MGLRDNWSPRRQFKSTVATLIMTQRLAKAAAATKATKIREEEEQASREGSRRTSTDDEGFRTAEEEGSETEPTATEEDRIEPVKEVPTVTESAMERMRKAVGGLRAS